MKKIFALMTVLAAVPALAQTPAPTAPSGVTTTGSVLSGVTLVDNDTNSAAFTQYRDLEDSVFLSHLRFNAWSQGKGLDFTVGGVNIGRREYVSVDQLARLVAEVAGKKIRIEHVEGPVGVRARNFLAPRMAAIGWESKVSLREGISRTYPWVESQVKAAAVAR